MHRRLGIREKATIMMILLTMLPVMIMGTVLADQYRNMIIDKLNIVYSKNMLVANQQLKLKFDILASCLQQISDSHYVQGLADKPRLDRSEYPTVQRKLYREMYRPGYLQELYLPFVYMIVLDNGDTFSSMTEVSGEKNEIIRHRLEEMDEFHRIREGELTSGYAMIIADNLLIENGGRQLYFARKLTWEGRDRGFAIIGINVSYINMMLEHLKMTENSRLFLNDNGADLCINTDGGITDALLPAYADGTKIKYGGNEHMIWTSRFEPYGTNKAWTLYMLVPISDMDIEISSAMGMVVLLMLITCVLILIMIWIVRRRLIRPVMHLCKGMAQVQKGDMTIRVDVNARDELGQLCEGFNQMLGSLNESMQRIHEEEEVKHKLELQVLQAQINPHFVKNTLNTVRRMAEMKGAMGISRAISAFIAMIDYSFGSKYGNIVSLSDELYYLEQYILIQKIRYQNLFDYEVQIPQSLASAQIPKLILQPLVENSIQHGIAELGNYGKIVVSAETVDGELLLHVRDDGAGMSKDRIDALLTAQRDDGNGDRLHIGLQNVRRRLKTNYGIKYDIAIQSETEQYTDIALRLPLHLKESTHE